MIGLYNFPQKVSQLSIIIIIFLKEPFVNVRALTNILLHVIFQKSTTRLHFIIIKKKKKENYIFTLLMSLWIGWFEINKYLIYKIFNFKFFIF